MSRRLLFLLILIAGYTSAARGEVLTIGTDPWCPYNCEDPKKQGIVVELFREILAREGHEVRLEFYPWARAIVMLKKGHTTTFGSANRKDAPEMTWASVPTVDMRNTIFARADDHWQYQGPASLTRGRLGVIHNYNYGRDIDRYIADPKNAERIVKVSGLNSLERLLRMLASGRLRFIIDDQFVTMWLAHRLKLGKSIRPVKLVSKVPLYFGFAPGRPASKRYATIVDAGLLRMQRDGTMAAVFQRYGVTCFYCRP